MAIVFAKFLVCTMLRPSLFAVIISNPVAAASLLIFFNLLSLNFHGYLLLLLGYFLIAAAMTVILTTGTRGNDRYHADAWSSSTLLLEMKMNLKKKRILLSLRTIQKSLNTVTLDFFYVWTYLEFG